MQRFSDNVQGAIFMAVSMLGYVVNDALIKLTFDDLNLYQAIFLRGAAITVIVGAIARRTARIGDLRHHISVALGVRVATEVLGTVAFLNALAQMPIANATAILQVVPLSVTLAAALVLGESVGWRRYVAIGFGFAGVLVVVRPDAGGFNRYAVLALITVVMVTVRDLATRRLSPDLPSALVAVLTAVSISVMGLSISFLDGWAPMTGRSLAALAGAATFLSVGYIFSIKTVRVGDLSFSAPVRYSVLIWALILGVIVFGESLDMRTIAGECADRGIGSLRSCEGTYRRAG